MKPQDIMQLPEAELAAQLKALKLKELERHTEKLVNRLCSSDYKTLMAAVIKIVPTLKEGDRFQSMQTAIRPHLKEEKADDEESVKRLSLLVMITIAKKFEAIHNQ